MLYVVGGLPLDVKMDNSNTHLVVLVIGLEPIRSQ